jgi:hypothetical protein
MTDYKALCAELLGALENEGHAHWPGGPDGDPLIEQARAALALPEPEGPSDEELLAVAAGAINPYETCGIAIGEYEAETECAIEVYGSELIAFARAALARWGCPQPEPETDDSLTNYPKVTRVEVITSKGREFVQHECAYVQFSLQDDGRTIKVFLSSNDQPRATFP